MAAPPVFPRVHVMVLCDEIEDVPDEPDVFNLTGVRTQIRANTFPHTHPQLCVYLQVTGHQGMAACRISIIPAGEDVEVFDSPEQQVQFEGPLTVVPVLWEVQDCTFPRAGVYYCQVYFGHKLVSERLLTLTEDVGDSDGEEESP